MVAENVKVGKYVGDSFGGRVVEAETTDVCEFFDENKALFSPLGRKSFYRMMGIPGSFFEKQPTAIQTDLLKSQKQDLKSESQKFFSLMDAQGSIQACAPASQYGWKDPKEFLSLTDGKFRLRAVDYVGGNVQYVTNFTETGYQPALFISIPVFYYGRVKIEAGIFKVKCTNGAVDRVNVGSLTVGKKELNPDIFRAVVGSMGGAMDSRKGWYSKFEDYLRSKKLAKKEDALTLVGDFAEKSKAPRSLALMAEKHIAVSHGEDEKPLDNMPEKMESVLDVFDVLTRCARALTFGSQVRAEGEVFTYFNRGYMASTQDKAPRLDVAEYRAKFKPAKEEE